MISGATDSNVMVWTTPLDGYQGEVIEGIDMSLAAKAGRKKTAGSQGGLRGREEVLPTQNEFGLDRANHSMSVEVAQQQFESGHNTFEKAHSYPRAEPQQQEVEQGNVQNEV